MPRSDTTPIRDPRNAVGLLADVMDLVLVSPQLSSLLLRERLPFVVAKDLSREFAKSPRRVLNGSARKPSGNLYQRIKTARTKIVVATDPDYLMRDDKKRRLLASVGAIGDLGLRIAEMAMEDVERWTKYTHGWTEQRPNFLPPTEHEAQWHVDWHDCISAAVRLGVDGSTILNFECGWRFRDLTDREHRGGNIRAAFEAAWLAGQYTFAMQLIEKF